MPATRRCTRRYMAWLAVAAALLAAPATLAASQPAASRGDAGVVRADGPLARALFERNDGQDDPAVRYRARIRGGMVRFADAGLELATPTSGERAATTRVEFVDPAPGRSLAGTSVTPTRISYLLGSDPAGWHAGIPTYEGVRYHELWPGIDLDYGAGIGALKGTYTVAPGVDPGVIRWRYTGARVRLAADQLLVTPTTPGATPIVEDAPVSWQDTTAGRVPVRSAYRLRPDGSVGFTVGRYDRSRPLIVDPSVSWSFLMPPQELTGAHAVAALADGGVVVAGQVADHPVMPGAPALSANGYQRSYGGGVVDAWIAKVSVTGELTWLTYLGGSGDDILWKVAADTRGRIGFAGRTTSPDFPTHHPVQRRNTITFPQGNADDAVTGVLSTDGRSLVYSTYLSSPGRDEATGVRFDRRDQLVVTGTTLPAADDDQGRSIPASPGRYGTRSASRPGPGGGFVAQFTTSGQLAWVARIWTLRATNSEQWKAGDTDLFRIVGLDLDGQGNIVLAGFTQSLYAPVTPGVVQQSRRSGSATDGYLAKLSADGRRLLWGTHLGGAGADALVAVALDRHDNVYAYGQTVSPDFPRVAPIQPACATASAQGEVTRDVTLTKLTADAKRIVYSTCLGGSAAEDLGNTAGSGGSEPTVGFTVDPSGTAYLVGQTESPDFPQRQAWQSFAGYPVDGQGADSFVAQVTPAGKLGWASFLGGHFVEDSVGDVAYSPSGAITAVGFTHSPDFPGAEVNPAGALYVGPAGGSAYVTRITNG